MTSEQPTRIRKLFTQFKPGQRFYVFIISITLASAFWLLNALNKTYNKNVLVVLKYTNKPADLAYTRMPPQMVEIEIRGDGFSLLQIEDKIQEDTAVIDLSRLEFVPNQSGLKASISSNRITSRIQETLSNNLLISKVSVDSIGIRLEPGMKKMVNIQPNVNYALAAGITLQQPVFSEPNQVEVYGPKSKLQHLDTLYTAFTDLGVLVKSYEGLTPIDYDKNVMVLGLQEITLNAVTEQITEGEITVPVEAISMVDSIRVRLLPQEVTIKYTTGLSHFDDISQALFRAKAYYNGPNNAPTKLPITVNQMPHFIQIVEVSPERVDYLIINK